MESEQINLEDEMKGGSLKMKKQVKIRLPQAINFSVPQYVEAAYENHWAGNLMAYPLDPDPVRGDSVYNKLKDLEISPLYWDRDFGGGLKEKARVRYGKVAWGLKETMRARKMNERQYRHLADAPIWRLKLEFTVSDLLNDLIGRSDVEVEILEKEFRFSDDLFERKKAIHAYLKSRNTLEE